MKISVIGTGYVGTVSAACFAEFGHDVNIENPMEHTILEFAKIIFRITGSSSKISFKDLPVDYPKQRRPNKTKPSMLLDWEPRFSLEQGLKETIKYFRQIMNVQ